jgi:hypothetical protein
VDDTNTAAGQPPKNNKRKAAVERLTKSNVQPITGPPDFIIASKRLLDVVGGELVPLDVGDVAVVPLEAGNHHPSSVARCIYNQLQA